MWQVDDADLERLPNRGAQPLIRKNQRPLLFRKKQGLSLFRKKQEFDPNSKQSAPSAIPQGTGLLTDS